MGGERKNTLLQHLRKVLDPQAARELSDGEALRLFAAQRDETAFAALMQRHGPLVLGVCRHVLHNLHDAEDAFQATFLVLARNAASIRKERSIASWLHGVAYRTALKARRAAGRRRRHESQAPPAAPVSPTDLGWRELQALLDEELSRLPEKYRQPFVLCCLESRSKKEAADELGWKEGTVSSRLAQARKLLQTRLARRGVTLSAVLAGLTVAREGAAASVPAALAATTLQASLTFAGSPATPSGRAADWARSQLRGLTLARAKLPAALLLLVALAGGGAALLARTSDPPDPSASDATRPEVVRQDPGPGDRAAAATMTVAGQILGPDGRPAAGARVAVLTALYRRPGDRGVPTQEPMRVLGSGTVDGEGRFRLAVPQTDVGHHFRLTLLSSAPGCAPNAAFLDRLASTHDVPLRLQRAQSLRGRLLGPDGRPARGVRVWVTRLKRPDNLGINLRLAKPTGPLPAWPGPAVTDGDGRFTLAGVGPEMEVDLEVHDERYSTQRFPLRTGKAERADTVTLRLAPARTIEGRITEADTGRSLAGAYVAAVREGFDSSPLTSAVDGRTNADGRFRLRPFPGSQHSLRVSPPAGSPYLLHTKRLRWPRGAARLEVSLALKRGVLVRGRVTEEGSGRPVVGATVEDSPRYDKPDGPGPDDTDRALFRRAGDARTGADGSFALAVFPGQGHLLVKGPTPDYLHVETSRDRLQRGRSGGEPYFPDALMPFDLPRGAGTHRVAITLRRGVTVRGRVLTADGKPVASGVLVSPTHVPRGWTLTGDQVAIRNGRFELPGCDPKGRVSVWFFDARSQQGAYVELPGTPAGELVVRLVPCRTTVVTIRGPDGKPLVRPQGRVELVLWPGVAAGQASPNGVGDRVTVPAWTLYGRGYTSYEGQTTLALPWLIPEAPYALRIENRTGWSFTNEFKVSPGQGALRMNNLTLAPRPRR